MCPEEEMNPRVNQRDRNKREAEQFKNLYASSWDIPIFILILLLILLFFLSFRV